MTETKRVLFVCLGNICRSPSAEGVFRAFVAERGLGAQVEVDSAGTGVWHAGELPDPRSRQAAAKRGYRLDSRARQVEADDFQRFDLIVAMDRDNLRTLHAMRQGRARVCLLSEFLPPGSPPDVPDPYYGGTRGFEQVLDMIEAACEPLLAALSPPAASR